MEKRASQELVRVNELERTRAGERLSLSFITIERVLLLVDSANSRTALIESHGGRDERVPGFGDI